MLDELDLIGAVVFETEAQREDIRRELTAIGNRYGKVAMIVIAGFEAGGIGLSILSGQDLIASAVLGVFCLICSLYAGLRFGQFYGNGQLFTVLTNHKLIFALAVTC
jgi:hypothetical protein